MVVSGGVAWSLDVPGRPRSKGNSKRVVRRGRFSRIIPSAAAVEGEASARSVIAAHAPATPLVGPLRVDVTFWFTIPPSRTKGKNRVVPGQPCLLHVDRGNLLKLIEDAANGLVWVDDSQIVSGNVEKRWGLRDMTSITVREEP